MHPIYGKYQRFQNFKKYSYSEISNPTQSLKEQFQSFATIFLNSQFRTTYLKDLNHIKQKPSVEVERARDLQTYYKLYKGCDLVILSYVVTSFYWHYKKGYFHIHTSKKLPLIDLYIIGKIIFNVFLISSTSFFLLKKFSDPILFEYFEKKEIEWEEQASRLSKEKEEFGMMRGGGDKKYQ